MTDPVLERMNLEPRPVRPEFRIAGEVIEAASHWRLFGGEAPHLRCNRCLQSVMTTGSLTVAELSAAVLAHLMQTHEWTREAAAG
jgi:hypothetical protein